jgi:hypothetical protein
MDTPAIKDELESHFEMWWALEIAKDELFAAYYRALKPVEQEAWKRISKDAFIEGGLKVIKVML